MNAQPSTTFQIQSVQARGSSRGHFMIGDAVHLSSLTLAVTRGTETERKTVLSVRLTAEARFDRKSNHDHPPSDPYRGSLQVGPAGDGKVLVGIIGYQDSVGGGTDDDDVEIFIATATPTVPPGPPA